ncbi:cytochrome c biogenesis protein CcsA [bacterium]|nr:cytochrome c biogenesis protein CcsA [bacterium]
MNRTMLQVAWIGLVLTGMARGEEPKSVGYDWDIWRKIVVLDDGRAKPMDTLAWEQIYSFAGKSKWKPSTVATVSVADIPDWSALANKLLQKEGPAAELAKLVPFEWKETLPKTNWQTAPLEEELLSIDMEIRKRRDAFVKEIGIDKTLAEFRAEATDTKDKELLKKFDDLLAQIDGVGRTKVDILHFLNENPAVSAIVPAKLVEEVAASKEATDLDRAVARRKHLEAILGDAIKPLPAEAFPAKGLARENRKYDPVELAVTLVLTWSGWDKPEEVKKLLTSSRPGSIGFDRIYWDFHQPDPWDTAPILDARFQDLAPKLQGETASAASIRTIHANRWFIDWALRIAKLEEDKPEKRNLSTADKKSVEILRAYRSFVELRTGQTIFLAPDQNIKNRITSIESKLGDLSSKLASADGKGFVAVVETWQASINDSDPFAADLREVADRLLKELRVTPDGEKGGNPQELLEQQQRLKIESIANEARWMNILEILALPEIGPSRGYSSSQIEPIRASLSQARAALLADDPAAFNTASSQLADLLSAASKDSYLYPSANLVQTELHYNKFQPFLWTVVFSGLALVMLILSLGIEGPWLYRLGFMTLLVAVGFMIYGTTLRIMISGRPPVTNMYETIIWASFIMATLSIVLGLVYGHRIIVATGAMALTPATLLAYVMPPEFGNSISPLVPVLRDNFWLVIHVLTIVASYGAFMLAWMLGNVGLTYYLVGKPNSTTMKPIAQYIYRSIQVGVLLLGAGTLLGGWWAAYSWGRFWGWDPKEVWALIAFIGYIAVLHARFAGLLKTFGLIVMSVLAFSGVVMSWYGVNFVLGEGLHAYAFGDGGQPYVFAVVLANLAYVALVVGVHSMRRSSTGMSAVSSPMTPQKTV